MKTKRIALLLAAGGAVAAIAGCSGPLSNTAAPAARATRRANRRPHDGEFSQS